MDLVFWDPGVAKRYCSRNSFKVRQCWLDGVLFIAYSYTHKARVYGISGDLHR